MRPLSRLCSSVLPVALFAGLLSVAGAPTVSADVSDEMPRTELIPTVTRGPAALDPSLEAQLAKEAGVEAIVTAWSMKDLDEIERSGISGTRLRMLPIMIVDSLSRAQFDGLRQSTALRSLWANHSYKFSMEDTTWIVKAREAWAAASAGGRNVTGRDVHVAVIDTGADGQHQDMDNLVEFCEGAPAVSRAALACSPFNAASGNAGPAGTTNEARKDSKDLPDGLGHGSHVAGTIAGTGDASGGRRARHSTTGIAPDAKIHAYSVNAANSVSIVGALAAYDDIMFKKMQLKSGVVAINNSWGNDAAVGPAYNPSNPVEVAIQEAYRFGILSVFAAGNSGPGHGSISSYCASPWVVCVAATNKGDGLADFSSRGRPSEPADTNGDGVFTAADRVHDNHDRQLGQMFNVGVYRPTLSAPGVQIKAVNANDPNCREGSGPDAGGCYQSISGTSMATPHVVGAVALVVEAYRKAHGNNPTAGTLIEILERSSNLQKLPGYETEEQGAGRLDVVRAIRFASTYPQGLPSVNWGHPTPTYVENPRNRTVLLNQAGCTGNASALRETDPVTGAPRYGQHFIDVPQGVDRLTVRWDFPSITSGQSSAAVNGGALRLWRPGVNPDASSDPAGPTKVFADGTGGREADIRNPEPGRWTVRVYVTAVTPPLPCSATSSETPKQTEGFNYQLTGRATKVSGLPSVSITHPSPGQTLSSRIMDVTGTASYPSSWQGIGNWQVAGTGNPRPSRPADTRVVTPLVLHMDGNLEDGCSGNGSDDVEGCGGPFLRPASARVASLSPAAKWNSVSPLFDGTTDRNAIDPNWTWELNGQKTYLAGPMSLSWWASCPGCAGLVGGASWDISLWADGIKVAEQRVRATPASSDVPSRLSATMTLPFVSASNRFVVMVDPVFFDTQSNTNIYYDSVQPCPRAVAADSCDSTVTLPVTTSDPPPAADPAGPAPPGDLRIQDVEGGLKVAWAPSTGATQAAAYEIHRSTDPLLAPGPSTLLAVTSGTSCLAPEVPSWMEASRSGLCFVDQNADPNVTYYYRVAGVTSAGFRGLSSLLAFGTETQFDRRVRLKADRRYGAQAWEYATLSGPEGTSWSHVWDTIELIGGLRRLTARSYTQGIGSAPSSVDVDLIRPSGICDPGGLGFWRQQARQDSSKKFTKAEYETLASRASSLSESGGSRYFLDGSAVTRALMANPLGAEGAEERTARQFAALLLNVAAAELSPNMSWHAGVPSSALLDPALYDTFTVGETVGDAVAWIRSQLPDGALGLAQFTAERINSDEGLSC